MVTWKNLIKNGLSNKNVFSVRVKGHSMYPIIMDGSVINVDISQSSTYRLGDVLVFPYKNEGIIIHRLLKINNGRCFCKGDNSLRLEDIEMENIIGVAQIDNDRHNNKEFIEVSLLIAKIYRECKYNAKLTRVHPKYQEFKNMYLK